MFFDEFSLGVIVGRLALYERVCEKYGEKPKDIELIFQKAAQEVARQSPQKALQKSNRNCEDPCEDRSRFYLILSIDPFNLIS